MVEGNQISTAKIPLNKPGVLPDDPVSEAGRKILAFHFQRMLNNEQGSRQGDDIEALHDMRVAIRRMRAAYQVFGSAYKKASRKQFTRDLRELAQCLGPTRDLDVFLENLQHYMADSQTSTYDDLIAMCARKRVQSRHRMLRYLNSPEHTHFKERFAVFLHSPGLGVRKSQQAQIVRISAQHKIRRRYEKIFAYAPIITSADVNTLHDLRIDIKRFRYTMEFFREVLGSEIKSLIKATVRIQDHLGVMHDADVATGLMQTFLQQAAPSHNSDLPYLEHCERQIHCQVNTFSEVWDDVISPLFLIQLSNALKVLEEQTDSAAS